MQLRWERCHDAKQSSLRPRKRSGGSMMEFRFAYRNWLLAALVTLPIALSGHLALAADASLTVASCPPWKHEGDKTESDKMVKMCGLESKKITEALAANFAIEESNQHTLLQQQATPANLVAKLDEMRNVVSKGDTLYIFQMSHGGI